MCLGQTMVLHCPLVTYFAGCSSIILICMLLHCVMADSVVCCGGDFILFVNEWEFYLKFLVMLKVS